MSPNEKALFLKLFIDKGYVLDFSDSSFATFTMDSVNVDIKAKYGLSKGKSLIAFSEHADEKSVQKLFADLIKYYELNILSDSINSQEKNLYSKCKKLTEQFEKNLILIDTPTIKTVNQNYITELSQRAFSDIKNGEFDSAFTKARTIIEEVFCFAIESQKQHPMESGDISRLYNQVKSLYCMHQSPNMDKRINSLLSGIEKIISSVSEMRNKGSDSHGLGKRRLSVKDYHARLYVNSATTIADFILSVVENKLNSKTI